MSRKKLKSGSVLGFLLNLWTITTLALALSGTVDIPWWMILGPYMLLMVLALVGFLILGLASMVESDK